LFSKKSENGSAKSRKLLGKEQIILPKNNKNYSVKKAVFDYRARQGLYQNTNRTVSHLPITVSYSFKCLRFSNNFK
jgi:hypothetical protein